MTMGKCKFIWEQPDNTEIHERDMRELSTLNKAKKENTVL